MAKGLRNFFAHLPSCHFAFQGEILMATLTLEELTKKVSELEERLKKLEEKHSFTPFKDRPNNPRLGLTIEEAKAKIAEFNPTEEDIEYALGIVGIWRSGIGDLSENFRDYLYGIKKIPKEEK